MHDWADADADADAHFRLGFCQGGEADLGKYGRKVQCQGSNQGLFASATPVIVGDRRGLCWIEENRRKSKGC